MPRREAAISDEVLRREAHSLSDDVLLLPEQVKIITGLSTDQLRERSRTRPPKPPLREPREGPHNAVWYSLGECRRYRATLKEDAELAARAASTLKGWKGDKLWPVAFIGQFRHPVNFWETVRGKFKMDVGDDARWMTRKEFNDARQLAVAMEEDARRAEHQAERLSKRVNGHGKSRPHS